MIDKYLNELEANGRSKNTIKAYKLVLGTINEYKSLDTITKDDLVAYFKDFKGADNTRQLYSVILKAYFKSIGKPEVASWLKPMKAGETVSPYQVLTASDVNTMIEATDSLLFKLMLALFYETGARPVDILNLKWNNFFDTEDGIELNFTVKKTRRTGVNSVKMLIPLSEQYFKNLRDSTKHNRDDRVFPLKETAATTYRYAFEVIKEIGRRARINNKPCNPRAFRYARATDDVMNGVQESIIRKKMGWEATSAMIARYQKLADDAVVKSQKGNGKNGREEFKVAEKIDVQNKLDVVDRLEAENAEMRQVLDEFQDRDEQRQKEMDSMKRWFENVIRDPVLLDKMYKNMKDSEK